ncbi:MAG: hypothetical protein WC824_14010 [Bacteroidota bacterium]|jgi:hypothetical protein
MKNLEAQWGRVLKMGDHFQPSDVRVQNRPERALRAVPLFRKSRHDPRRWDRRKQSHYIESLISGFPPGSFYSAHVGDTKGDSFGEILNGSQRLLALAEYLDGDFPLEGLELLPQYSGKMYKDLPMSAQRRIDETTLVFHSISMKELFSEDLNEQEAALTFLRRRFRDSDRG